MKLMTLSEAESKRRKAVEFLRRIGNLDAAAEFDSMSPQEYAERKDAELVQNPTRRSISMARRAKSKDEIQAELDEANDYIRQLEAKLDNIAGVLDDEEDDEDENEDEADEEDEEDDDQD